MKIKNKSTDSNLLMKNIKHWKEFIESLPYPACLHDTEFNIVAANKTFSETYKGQGKLEGMKCYELFFHFDSKKQNIGSCPVEKTLKNGTPDKLEIYDPSTRRFLQLMTSPVVNKEKLIGCIHMVADVTSWRKSLKDSDEIIMVYAEAVNELKEKEQNFLMSRDAFFNMLEDVSESFKALEELFLGVVRAMVNALDAKSPWTKGHSENVAMYAENIAREMGLSENKLKRIKLAGILHDIGKIGTYDYLLDKPGKLTKEEFEVVKKHPSQGAKILDGIKQLKDIIPTVRHHHERIDGKGYPDGLKDEEIPLHARILHVADSFDSMTSDRPYRPAPSDEYAISEFKKYAGVQFDANVVAAFLRAYENGRKKKK